MGMGSGILIADKCDGEAALAGGGCEGEGIFFDGWKLRAQNGR